MIKVQRENFDVGAELATLYADRQHVGAVASFIGLVRDVAGPEELSAMTLEHYPGMTEKQLAAIVEEIKEVNELLDVLVLHRVGVITPGEEIVLVCCWSSHRKAAFDSCRAIMEALKSKAPFWKKETLNDGERWVARNTPG